MQLNLTREQALDLLKKYNTDNFHLRHAYTVEAVMRWFANDLGFADEADYWATAGFCTTLILKCGRQSIVQRLPSC